MNFRHISFVLLAIIVASAAYLLRSDLAADTRIETIAPIAATSETAYDQAASQKVEAAEAYGRLPMHFEPNRGQVHEDVKFSARGPGYSLFITERESVLSLQRQGKDGKAEQSAVVRMKLAGDTRIPEVTGEGDTGGRTNYFIGNDPEGWQTDIPNFERVRLASVYKDVDLVYYGNGQQLEYDFVVRPGGQPEAIGISIEGVDSAKVDESTGDLVLDTGKGELRQLKPFVYQVVDGERREVASNYKLRGSKSGAFEISFSLGAYDRTRELVIDPILVYGSYLGGNAFDEGRSIAVDAQGNAYIVGTAASRDFPTTPGTIKPVLLSRTDSPNSFWYDAFVTKMNASGTGLVFSTYYGGRNGNETGGGVAIDASGNVLISGTTMSADLPVLNAYQSTFGGTDDAFTAKLNPTGSAIIYSTYLGGLSTDLGGSIAVNQATGDSVVVGYASSGNFPTTPGAYKEKLCDNTPGSCNGIFYTGSFLVKLSANGSAVYSTLFTATINDVTLDSMNNAVFVGSAGTAFPATPGAYKTVATGLSDGIIAKMNPAGNALVYGTFLGGGFQSDRVTAVTLDAEQNIYVTGRTENVDFPTTPGAYDTTFNGFEDGFVTKLNAAGTALVYSTFLGGTAKDQPFAIGLAAGNEVFVAGETLSNASFPLRNPLLQTGTIFAARLNADASALIFSTFLGNGGAYDLAVDQDSNAYLTGHTTSIITTTGAFQTIKGDPTSNSTKDAFVVKLAPIDENGTFFSISGTVDDSATFSVDQAPVTVTLTGTVNRSMTLAYSGNGIRPYSFGSLPAGGTYTVSARKMGYATEPESVTFPNLAANQFADFTILDNEKPVGVITTPSHGQTFNIGAPVTIQATASDPDGHTITKVDFVAYSSATGSVPLGTDTTAPYEFTWNGASIGTWALYAYPTDQLGLRGDSTPTVHINVVDPTGANVAIVSPTEGQAFTQGSYVPIQVSVSSSVAVVEVRDQTNTLVARMTGAPWSSQWRVMETGNYTLTATAFTQTNQQATSNPVNIVVNQINHRITGRILNDLNNAPIAGVNVALVSTTNPNITAQAVTDSDGRYLFTGLGTTPNDGVTITPTLSGYTFAPATRNIVYLGFIDWNFENFSGTPQTQITVAMTNPTPGQVFYAPATIDLAADATSGAGTITKVDFFRRNNNGSSTLLGTDTTAPYQHQLTGIGIGNYNYFVQATDSTNAVAESNPVAVQVLAPTVTMSGRITGPNGEGVPDVTVYIGGGVAWTEQTDANGNFVFANYPGGRDYHFTPTPANGITFTPVSRSYTNVVSNITNIDFTASVPNQPPTLQLLQPTDGAVYTLPQPIPIQVTASDPDNNINRLRVMANNGSQFITIVQTNATTINTSWQPPTPGTYQIIADVRDAWNVTVSTQITITVNPPPPVTISGRVVDRDSAGIAGVNLELRDYPAQDQVVGTATTDATGNFTIPNVATFASYVLRASKLNYTFSPQQRLYFNVAANQTNADFTGTLQLQLADFDGDGGSDYAVWRPSTGVWHVSRSLDNSYTSQQFGGGSFGDVVVPGNYDGDLNADIAVYRAGVWYIQRSSNGTVRIESFGLADDKPVAGDFDGDGRTDIAVWRESNGTWHVLRSSDGGYSAFQFGMAGDKAISADYDGDGKADNAIWRPSTGVWYILQSSDSQVRITYFGTDGDMPLAGDFDGDKRADVAVFRPSTGVWYYMTSSDDTFRYRQWGIATDKLVPGDYDRDGKTDLAVFRESNGAWYILYSSSGSYSIRQFGLSGDIPIPAAYIR